MISFKNLKNTYVIAEIGVNHNNNINLAKKMIQKCKELGTNAVKFQTFKANTLALKNKKSLIRKQTNEIIIKC